MLWFRYRRVLIGVRTVILAPEESLLHSSRYQEDQGQVEPKEKFVTMVECSPGPTGAHAFSNVCQALSANKLFCYSY